MSTRTAILYLYEVAGTITVSHPSKRPGWCPSGSTVEVMLQCGTGRAVLDRELCTD